MGYLNNNGLSTLITLIKNALGSKVDKVTGKQLSTNDFTNELKTKVESYEPLQQATTDTLGGIVLGDAFQVDSEGKTQVKNAEIGVRGAVALSNDINSTSVTTAATPALVQAILEAAEGIPNTEKGVANGVATLDANGDVLISQLPSSVWQVYQFDTLEDLQSRTPYLTSTEVALVASDVDSTKNGVWVYNQGSYVKLSGNVSYDDNTNKFVLRIFDEDAETLFSLNATGTDKGPVTIGDKDSDADALTVTSGKEIYDEFKGSATGVVKDSDKLSGQPASYYGKAPLHLTATITAASWAGSVAPYTQEVAIAGILASDAPHITPVYSDTLATALEQKEAWGLVSEADAGAGKIVFTCFEGKPTVAVPIQVEVMR